MRSRASVLSSAELRRWDTFAAVWVLAWICAGVATSYAIWRMTGLSSSVVDSGHAFQSAGGALQSLADTPLIGPRIGEIGTQVVATGSGMIDRGNQARHSIIALSILVGIAVAVGPISPILFRYLPSRLASRRERRDVIAALENGGDNESVKAYLAHRAVCHLPLADLIIVNSDPRDALAKGNHDALARAELARMGLELPAMNQS